MSRKSMVAGIAMIVMVLATIPLLGSDNVPFLKWWIMMLILGMGFYPVTASLFAAYTDRGWLFSKVLAVAVSGFAVFALTVCKVTKFVSVICIVVTLICIILCWIYGFWKVKVEMPDVDLIFAEEALFLLCFLMWTYFAGFHPEAHGTEKFMDYGFMEAMMRSTELPARDIWYGMDGINYYYGGQYYAVFLTKLSDTDVKQTYNLMRTLVAAFAFVLPFSISYQMVCARILQRRKRKKIAPVAAGILSGAAVSLAGNMHYVIYGCIGKWLGWESAADYWFPDSTRYIGYNPVVENDKTIHEFPSYSFVLGDLHAHVVNVMFVLFVIGAVYAFVRRVQEENAGEARWNLKEALLQPHLIWLAVFIGIFHWTNYWDFVIYFVVVCCGILYGALYRFRCRAGNVILTVAVQAAEVFLIGTVTALPFTVSFETMVSGVALAKNHSMLYQLAILWGLPFFLLLLFLAAVFLTWKRIEAPLAAEADASEKRRGDAFYREMTENTSDEEKKKALEEERKGLPFREFWVRAPLSDIYAGILGICAAGLVLIPEIVYVRDIYEEYYARSNTMFKLTYQAFILFGIVMGYILVRFLTWKKEHIIKAFGVVGLICFLWTCGYFGTAVYSWFGNVLDPSQYRGLDATAYLENVFSQDASAIRWLDENVEGQPIVLEANGDSYSDYARVSAMTGLPTVLGWYVHEWLWRGDTQELNVRSAEIEQIYTSQDLTTVTELLEKYQISYIFVGSKEREKYAALNDTVLQQTGQIVYSDAETGTYILKVENS